MPAPKSKYLFEAGKILLYAIVAACSAGWNTRGILADRDQKQAEQDKRIAIVETNMAAVTKTLDRIDDRLTSLTTFLMGDRGR